MDRALVVRAQAGDEAAFRELAIALAPRFLRVALGILRDSGHAEDATQRALVRIWRQLPGLRDPGRFEAWAYRVLVNACRSVAQGLPRSEVLGTEIAEPLDTMLSFVDRCRWMGGDRVAGAATRMFRFVERDPVSCTVRGPSGPPASLPGVTASASRRMFSFSCTIGGSSGSGRPAEGSGPCTGAVPVRRT